MNILDFKKMNILFEWIFWIFIKWIIFWTNILVLVCPRQKLSSINVSKSSEIIQGSLMVPNSVHFRGSLFVDSVPCVPEERNSLDVYAKMWNDLKSRLWKSTSFFCKPIIKNKMNHSANKWKNALPKQGKFVGHDVSTAFVCQFAKVFSPQDFSPRQHVWPSCRTHPSSALQFGDSIVHSVVLVVVLPSPAQERVGEAIDQLPGHGCLRLSHFMAGMSYML